MAPYSASVVHIGIKIVHLQPNVGVQDQIAAPAQANAEAEPEGAYAADVHGGSDVEDPSDVEAPDHVLHAPAHVPGGAPLGIHVGDVQAQLEHGDLDAEDELDAYAQDAPLEDEIDPANVELDAWHHELDATDEEIATARSSTNAQAAKAAAWRDAEDERICDLLEDTPSVRQVAFQHLEDLYHGVPLNVVEKHIRDGVANFGGESSPQNPRNRHPPSLQICRVVLGVSSLDDYEEHLCASGCNHVFPHMSQRDWRAHAASRLCGPRYHLCRCSHCLSCRFKELEGGRVVASLMCYFLRDALQQLFYDPVWVRHMQHSREHARYWKSPEGQRLKAVLIRLGYDVDKVRNRSCSPRKRART